MKSHPPNPLLRQTTPIVATLLCLVASTAEPDPDKDNRADVPAALQVPDGNTLSFRAHAVGVQVYSAKPSETDPTKFEWIFKSPEAALSDTNGRVVGSHYAGPTWKTGKGSSVVGERVAGATLEATAIPWLLLRAKSTEGKGVLQGTTYIQRVNTSGGLAPTTPPTRAGQEARVPYTADYFFFRESQH